MQDIQDARAKADLAEKEVTESKAILEFYQENPQLALVANTNLLREFLNGQPITLESLRESLEFLGDRLATKDDGRLEKEAIQARAALEAEYLSLLPGTNDTKQSVMSRVKYKSDDELRSLIYQRKTEIDLRKHTAEEIRASLKVNREPQYPPLSEEWTRKGLLNLAPEKLRKLMRVHSEAAVNARLAGK